MLEFMELANNLREDLADYEMYSSHPRIDEGT
jgi:hypothetical protein